MFKLLLLVLGFSTVNALNPITYVPQSASIPFGQTPALLAPRSNILSCAFRCSQAYISSRSCTVFWMDGTFCNGAMCGKDCFTPAARAVAKNQTFYARTDVVSKGQVAIIAGGDLNGVASSTVELFSPDGGCQYSLTSLPQPLSGLSLDMAANQIMACSGYNTVTKLNNTLCWTYDIVGSSWYRQMSSLNLTKPYYPSFVFGFYVYFLNDVAAEKFQIFNGMGVSPWATTPPVATGTGACGVIWQTNFIIFGGKLGGKAVQMFDINAGTWKAKAPMNFARNFFSCVLLPSRYQILVLSTVPGINETTAELYNPVADTWASTGSTQYPRAGASLQVLGQRVFAISGGFTPSTTATVEEYNVALGTWSLAKASVQENRRNFGVASVPAAIFNNLPQGCVGV